jgi:glycosyltransferase involved in cell wall biosynthesis
MVGVIEKSCTLGAINESSPVIDEQSVASSLPRVLLVGPDFSGGGGERHFANLSRYLFGGTCDVTILCNSLSDAQTCELGERFLNLKWTSRLSYPRIIYQIRDRLIRNKYDCCLGFGMFPSVILYLAARGLSYSPSLISMEITRPVGSSKHNLGWRTILYTQLRRAAYCGCDMFLANSLDGVSESIKNLGVDENKAYRVPNIIENKRISDEKWSHNPYEANLPYIVSVSRLIQSKRVDDLLRAFASSSIASSSSLMIVGDGPEKRNLMMLATSLGISSKVTFSGYENNPYPIMYGASVFVLSSEYEGFSNSVLEAMFCDVPVITSFCSSDAREMCNYGAALGFEVGDCNQLAKHIVSIVHDNKLRMELVQHAREYRSSHALENAISFYEGLIRKAAFGNSYS